MLALVILGCVIVGGLISVIVYQRGGGRRRKQSGYPTHFFYAGTPHAA